MTRTDLMQRHPRLAKVGLSLLLLVVLVGTGALAAAEQRRMDARRRTDVVDVIDELAQDVITHNWPAMAELLTPDFVDHHDASTGEDADRRRFIIEMRDTVTSASEAVLTIDDVRVDADIATVRLDVTAQLSTSNDNRVVTATDIRMFRVVDGHIAEAW